MIFATPPIAAELAGRLGELDELRRVLGQEVSRPVPWMGALRRTVRASSIEGSTSIEGFSVDPEDAIALVSGEEPADHADENRLAVSSYARAMDHVGIMAQDPSFSWEERVILDLHFDACYFQRDKSPGQWRGGPIAVTERDGTLAYRASDAEEVSALMAEVVRWLREDDDDQNVVVRAAMAHLHVVSVHPFRDGNGRVARIVQSLVLAREGLISPEFSSIEEYLGRNTSAYYAALKQAQGGSYQPGRDTSGWVAFCVDAHLAQARQRLEQIKAAATRWGCLESLVAERGWPERLVIALDQSLTGGTERGTYGKEAAVSRATASADFRRLLDAGLVDQRGRGKNISYRASGELRSRVSQALEGN
ncbi:MAG TPA: Fic family protein [Solirubrobacterales bacterium]|nr:Fic family protein [Solirubrobacterales bacterium]